jgi:ketosteroid isomerase-like protein
MLPMLFFGLLVLGQSKDEAAVAKAMEQLRAAMISGDSASLASMTAEKLSYGHSNGHIDDKKEFVTKISSGVSDYLSIELQGQSIAISGDVAIVRHAMQAKTNDSGKPGELNLKVLLIWQKQKGKWVLLARQAVKVI